MLLHDLRTELTLISGNAQLLESWVRDGRSLPAEATLALAPPTFALVGFSMGGYVAFEIMRRAAPRVERLALMDTQATPDSAESTKRRRALLEQTKIGRFHGVQLSRVVLRGAEIPRPQA